MDEDYYNDYGDNYFDGYYNDGNYSSTEDTTSNGEDSTNTPGGCITISNFCFVFYIFVFNFYFMLKRVKLVQALQKAQQVVLKIWFIISVSEFLLRKQKNLEFLLINHLKRNAEKLNGKKEAKRPGA